MNAKDLENLTTEIFDEAKKIALETVEEDPDIDRPEAFASALAKAIREIDNQNVIFSVKRIDPSISVE